MVKWDKMDSLCQWSIRSTWCHFLLTGQTLLKLPGLSASSWRDGATAMGSSWGGVWPRCCPIRGGGVGGSSTSGSSSNIWLFLREIVFHKKTLSWNIKKEFHRRNKDVTSNQLLNFTWASSEEQQGLSSVLWSVWSELQTHSSLHNNSLIQQRET